MRGLEDRRAGQAQGEGRHRGAAPPTAAATGLQQGGGPSRRVRCRCARTFAGD